MAKTQRNNSNTSTTINQPIIFSLKELAVIIAGIVASFGIAGWNLNSKISETIQTLNTDTTRVHTLETKMDKLLEFHDDLVDVFPKSQSDSNYNYYKIYYDKQVKRIMFK